jgi:hypothetical protein
MLAHVEYKIAQFARCEEIAGLRNQIAKRRPKLACDQRLSELSNTVWIGTVTALGD